MVADCMELRKLVVDDLKAVARVRQQVGSDKARLRSQRVIDVNSACSAVWQDI